MHMPFFLFRMMVSFHRYRCVYHHIPICSGYSSSHPMLSHMQTNIPWYPVIFSMIHRYIHRICQLIAIYPGLHPHSATTHCSPPSSRTWSSWGDVGITTLVDLIWDVRYEWDIKIGYGTNGWLVVSNMTGLFSMSYMGCHPKPIDFHSIIFRRAGYTKTTNQMGYHWENRRTSGYYWYGSVSKPMESPVVNP